jgi:hypothetical protein
MVLTAIGSEIRVGSVGKRAFPEDGADAVFPDLA